MGNYAAMRRCIAFVVLAACGTEGEGMTPPDAEPVFNPCELAPTAQAGSVEPGLGETFTPIVEGQDATLTLGIQGLYMFVTNARVRDLEVGTGDLRGAVRFAAFDTEGQVLTLELGCRVREFIDLGDGSRALDGSYEMPFPPEVSDVLEGTSVTIRIDVRDRTGRQAVDQRTVIAHKP
jgi:hypothetical protein